MEQIADLLIGDTLFLLGKGKDFLYSFVALCFLGLIAFDGVFLEPCVKLRLNLFLDFVLRIFRLRNLGRYG